MYRLRSHFLTFTLLLMVAFVLVLLDQSARLAAPQDLGQRLTVSTEERLSRTGRTLSSFIEAIRDLDAIQAENAALRHQVDSLTLVNVQRIELEKENERLRELLGFQQEHPNYTLRAAEIVAQESPAGVIGLEPGNLARAVRINQGLEAGIEPGMSAITARGLVGRVLESGQGWAKVLLITDETSKITAVVQQTRAVGIVEGTAEGLVMRYILHEQRVEPGDVVLSAGLGDEYAGLNANSMPKGLVIGVVESVERSDISPWQEAVIRSTIDFSQLEYLWVIRSTSPLAPEDLR
jgi:rod shape-determining protein MreC